MRELSLNEFIFNVTDSNNYLVTIALFLELERTCCKNVINTDVEKKYYEKLKSLEKINDRFIQTQIVPMIAHYLHNADKTVIRNYHDKLNNPELEKHHDSPFIKAALASSDKTLVTSDDKLREFLNARNSDLNVVTPNEAWKLLHDMKSSNY